MPQLKKKRKESRFHIEKHLIPAGLGKQNRSPNILLFQKSKGGSNNNDKDTHNKATLKLDPLGNLEQFEHQISDRNRP